MRILKKTTVSLFILLLAFAIYQYRSVLFPSKKEIVLPQKTKTHQETIERLHKQINYLSKKINSKKYNTRICFLIDFKLPSGKNRFFVYDLHQKSILYAGLVAHGSGNKAFTTKVVISNTVESGCSSLGSYKISYKYKGRFGNAYKLIGLDSSNNNAFKRNVVLHAYDCVPDNETYPMPICNSLGCPMVSYNFLKQLEKVINSSSKPILLHIYK